MTWERAEAAKRPELKISLSLDHWSWTLYNKEPTDIPSNGTSPRLNTTVNACLREWGGQTYLKLQC